LAFAFLFCLFSAVLAFLISFSAFLACSAASLAAANAFAAYTLDK
jgi:hypothetical protein